MSWEINKNERKEWKRKIGLTKKTSFDKVTLCIKSLDFNIARKCSSKFSFGDHSPFSTFVMLLFVGRRLINLEAPTFSWYGIPLKLVTHPKVQLATSCKLCIIGQLGSKTFVFTLFLESLRTKNEQMKKKKKL